MGWRDSGKRRTENILVETCDVCGCDIDEAKHVARVAVWYPVAAHDDEQQTDTVCSTKCLIAVAEKLREKWARFGQDV